MRGRGRPSKLTPETQDKILSAIRAGNYAEVSAQYAGISRDTYFLWKRRGEARKREIEEAKAKGLPVRPDREADRYLNFLNLVHEAEAVSEVADMTVISVAAPKDWRAAAWRLEHKFPFRYGRQCLEVTGADGSPLLSNALYDLSRFTAEELSQMVRDAYADSQNRD